MILKTSKYFVATLELIKPIAVILLCILAIYLTFISQIFAITKFECDLDQEGSCQNEFVKAEISESLGSNLFLLDEHKLKSRLQTGDPTIRKITVTKILPNTLKLELLSVYPTYAVRTKGSSWHMVLNDQHQIIKATEQDPHVPVIILDQSLTLRVGQKIEDQAYISSITNSLKILRSFPPSSAITLVGQSLYLDIEGDTTRTAIFTLAKPVEDQILALRSILQNATIPRVTHEIDVRFNQPILR